MESKSNMTSKSKTAPQKSSSRSWGTIRQKSAGGEIGRTLHTPVLRREHSYCHSPLKAYQQCRRLMQNQQQKNLAKVSAIWSQEKSYVPAETVQGICMTNFASARKQVAGHGKCKDHHFLHEQRREQQLQQLQKHFPPQHRRPSICSNYSDRLQKLAMGIYLESQNGLRLETSTIGMIFFLQRQEKRIYSMTSPKHLMWTWSADQDFLRFF